MNVIYIWRKHSFSLYMLSILFFQNRWDKKLWLLFLDSLLERNCTGDHVDSGIVGCASWNTSG